MKQENGIEKQKIQTTISESINYINLGIIAKKLKSSGYKLQLTKPLSKMIYRQIKNALPKGFMSNSDIYDAIGFHVKSPKYLLRLRPEAVRYDIRGKKHGKVTQPESKYALESLYKHHSELMRTRKKARRKKIQS